MKKCDILDRIEDKKLRASLEAALLKTEKKDEAVRQSISSGFVEFSEVTKTKLRHLPARDLQKFARIIEENIDMLLEEIRPKVSEKVKTSSDEIPHGRNFDDVIKDLDAKNGGSQK